MLPKFSCNPSELQLLILVIQEQSLKEMKGKIFFFFCYLKNDFHFVYFIMSVI